MFICLASSNWMMEKGVGYRAGERLPLKFFEFDILSAQLFFFVSLNGLFQFIKFLAAKKTDAVQLCEMFFCFFRLFQFQLKFPNLFMGSFMAWVERQCLFIINKGFIVHFQIAMTIAE